VSNENGEDLFGRLKEIISLPMSQVYFDICRAFNVLPTEERFRKLEPLQIRWLLAHLIQERKQLLPEKKKKEVDVTELDFDELRKQLPPLPKIEEGEKVKKIVGK